MERTTTRLKAQLQERFRRLCGTDMDSLATEVDYFLEWLASTPRLAAAVERIDAAAPTFDAEAFEDAHMKRNDYTWPPTEMQRAKVILVLLRHARKGRGEALGAANVFSGSSNFNDMVDDFCRKAISPFIDFLQDGLSNTSDLLYLLSRYKRRVEWFHSDRLHGLYTANTQKGEQAYDTDLRNFLFEQGIEYPFSQADSPSGRADVVAGLESPEPLVLELKLFDGERRGVAHIAQGLQQVRAYAHDYHQDSGHLVVVNLTEDNLVLPSDGDFAEWPPRLHVDERTFYITVVNGRSQRPVSKSKARDIEVDRDSFVRVKAGATT